MCKINHMKHTYIATINNETREATMRLYGTIGTKVDGDLFAQELASLDSIELDHIKLRINTPGGDVLQGMSIVSAMLSMQTPVHAYVDGVAASMGAVIAVTAGKVYMADFAKLMIHDPYFMGSDDTELSKKERKMLERVTDMLRQVLSRRNKKEGEITRLMKEETWFSADEAKLAGLCDEVIPSTKTDLKDLAPKQLVAVVDADYQSIGSDLRDRILPILGLSAMATDNEIITALSGRAETPESELEKALQMGFIDKSQLTLLRALGRSDITAFRQYIREKESGLPTEIGSELDKAVQSGKIIVFERNVFEDIGKRLGLKTLKGVLSVMPDRIMYSELIKTIKNNHSGGLTLNDYRKYAPQALKNDPELYASLISKENERHIEPELGLDYYRVHDPEYLAANPDEYKRLVEKKKTK